MQKSGQIIRKSHGVRRVEGGSGIMLAAGAAAELEEASRARQAARRLSRMAAGEREQAVCTVLPAAA